MGCCLLYIIDMAPPDVWLQILAWTKTLFEATKAAIDFDDTYARYKNDRETLREARRVSIVFPRFH